MKQIHLNILLPVALLVSLAAAAAVFVIPLPFLGAPDIELGANNTNTGAPVSPNTDPNLPVIEPQDWNTLVDALEATRVAPAGLPEVAIEEPPEDPGDGGVTNPNDQSMLNGLQWAYVGNIVEPARVVACIEMEGKQTWIVEGQTTAASNGLEPFDVTIQSVSESEIVVEFGEASRSFPLVLTRENPDDFELAT